MRVPSFDEYRPFARKALAALLLVVCLFLTWRFLVQPVIDFAKGASSTIETQSAVLERMKSQAKQVPILENSLSRLESEKDSNRFVYGQETTGLALAAMDAQIRSLASSNNVTIRMIQTREEGNQAELTRLTAQITLSLPPDRLGALLSAIEMAKPFLFVQALTIANPAGPSAARHTGKPGALEVRATVFAYYDGEKG